MFQKQNKPKALSTSKRSTIVENANAGALPSIFTPVLSGVNGHGHKKSENLSRLNQTGMAMGPTYKAGIS